MVWFGLVWFGWAGLGWAGLGWCGVVCWVSGAVSDFRTTILSNWIFQFTDIFMPLLLIFFLFVTLSLSLL